jgi:hypothetical protein
MVIFTLLRWLGHVSCIPESNLDGFALKAYTSLTYAVSGAGYASVFSASMDLITFFTRRIYSLVEVIFLKSSVFHIGVWRTSI